MLLSIKGQDPDAVKARGFTCSQCVRWGLGWRASNWSTCQKGLPWVRHQLCCSRARIRAWILFLCCSLAVGISTTQENYQPLASGDCRSSLSGDRPLVFLREEGCLQPRAGWDWGPACSDGQFWAIPAKLKQRRSPEKRISGSPRIISVMCLRICKFRD